MKEQTGGFRTVEEYIATFPDDVQARLEEMRATIRASAPGATERISYQMPAFVLHGNLVYYAAWKNHIGFYPASSGIEHFRDDLAGYARTKGAVQFPMDRPLPVDLISRIVQYRVDENTGKAQAKVGKKGA